METTTTAADNATANAVDCLADLANTLEQRVSQLTALLQRPGDSDGQILSAVYELLRCREQLRIGLERLAA